MNMLSESRRVIGPSPLLFSRDRDRYDTDDTVLMKQVDTYNDILRCIVDQRPNNLPPALYTRCIDANHNEHEITFYYCLRGLKRYPNTYSPDTQLMNALEWGGLSTTDPDVIHGRYRDIAFTIKSNRRMFNNVIELLDAFINTKSGRNWSKPIITHGLDVLVELVQEQKIPDFTNRAKRRLSDYAKKGYFYGIPISLRTVEYINQLIKNNGSLQ